MFFKARFWNHGLLACLLFRTALSQHTEAVCNITSLAWTFNSIGQSPCLIAAFLQNPCSTNGDFDVPKSGPGRSYTPPTSPGTCACSTVVYSLLSACSACQEGSIREWPAYSQNCTNTSSPDGIYPFAIPPGTAVPNWAYQKVTTSNHFDLVQARNTGEFPENSTSLTNSSSPSAPSANSASSSPSSSPSPTQPATAPSNKNHAGAIAGGVVGGIFGILFIAGLVAYSLFLLKKRRRDRDASQAAVFPPGSDPESQSRGKPSPDPMRSANESTYGSAPSYLPAPQASSLRKAYNPDDPSTFPPSHAPEDGSGRGVVY